MTDEDTSSFEVIENYIQSKNDEILCLDEDGIIMKQCGRNTSGDFYRIYMMCYDRIYPDEYYRSLKDANAKHAVANYMKNELKLRVFTSEMYLDVKSV